MGSSRHPQVSLCPQRSLSEMVRQSVEAGTEEYAEEFGFITEAMVPMFDVRIEHGLFLCL